MIDSEEELSTSRIAMMHVLPFVSLTTLKSPEILSHSKRTETIRIRVEVEAGVVAGAVAVADRLLAEHRLGEALLQRDPPPVAPALVLALVLEVPVIEEEAEVVIENQVDPQRDQTHHQSRTSIIKALRGVHLDSG